jgi:uncharacterized protein
MPLDKDILIDYRIRRCKETVQDAKIAVENNRLHNAENRIYYAIFYIVSALSLKFDYSTSKHIQLMGWFNRNFIKTGLFGKDLNKIYKNAFEKRQEGDYDDFIKFSLEEVKDDYEDMLYFVEKVEKLINS